MKLYPFFSLAIWVFGITIPCILAMIIGSVAASSLGLELSDVVYFILATPILCSVLLLLLD